MGSALRRLAVILVILMAVGACQQTPRSPPTSGEAQREDDEAATQSRTATASDRWRLQGSERLTAEHASGARLFVYTGAPDLDRGLPGVVEDGGRGPAYGLLSGYFAPRLLAAGATAEPVVRADGPHLDVQLDGLAVRALPPADGRIPLRFAGGGTLVFSADRTEVQGLLDGRPAFATNVTAGSEPGYRSWQADRLFVRPRRGAAFELTTDCPRVLMIHPVPRGSTSVFLLHVGPRPPPASPLFMPIESPPDAVIQEQSGCAPSGTSTLTVAVAPRP